MEAEEIEGGWFAADCTWNDILMEKVRVRMDPEEMGVHARALGMFYRLPRKYRMAILRSIIRMSEGRSRPRLLTKNE